jgi:hypothetical protein
MRGCTVNWYRGWMAGLGLQSADLLDTRQTASDQLSPHTTLFKLECVAARQQGTAPVHCDALVPMRLLTLLHGVSVNSHVL